MLSMEPEPRNGEVTIIPSSNTVRARDVSYSRLWLNFV